MHLDTSDHASKRSRRDENDAVHLSSFDQLRGVQGVQEEHPADVSILTDLSLGSLDHDSAEQGLSIHHNDDDGAIPSEPEHETMQSGEYK